MSTSQITESGMKFGPYPDGQFFHIEESNSYAAIQEHIKMAEFLLLRKNNGNSVMWIVEAKSSAPHPKTQSDFDGFIIEIRNKLVNAFSLGWASCLRRHEQAEAELSEDFKTLSLMQVDVKFVLVINGHQDEWLPPLQEALGKELRSTIRTWAFAPTSVAVINDALAKQHGLIQPSSGGGA